MRALIDAQLWDKLTLVLIFLATCEPFNLAIAQSPFSTAKADGSIVLDKGGFIQADFKEATFRVAYEFDNRDDYAKRIRDSNATTRVRWVPRYAFELQARPGGNVALFFDANELVAGARALGSFGFANLLSFQPSKDELIDMASGGKLPQQPLGIIYDWLTLQVSTERSRFTLYDPTQSFAEQFSTQDFAGYSLTLSYDAEFGGSVPAIVGISLGARKNNNADELTKVSVTDSRSFTSPDGSVSRTYDQTRSGLRGTYSESTPVILNTDLVLYPFLHIPGKDESAKASIAFDIFTRTTFGSDKKFIPGIGAYLTAPGAPLKVYGGINAYRGSDKRVALNIVAGFDF